MERLLSLQGPQGRNPTLDCQEHGLSRCIAGTGSCQEKSSWRGSSRGMDRRPRERCITDNSILPRGDSPRDRRLDGVATKARIP